MFFFIFRLVLFVEAAADKPISNAADDDEGIDDDTETAPLKAMQAAIIFIECSGRYKCVRFELN